MVNDIYNLLIKYLYGDNIDNLKDETIEKILYFIHHNKSIEFVMPSFPGKSSNINSSFNGKFGYEEQYSINNINKLLQGIQRLYPNGAKLYIIHDGHIFSDLNITRTDSELDEYINEFRKRIDDDIISISLKDLIEEKTYEDARDKFINLYVRQLDEKLLSGELIKKEILFTKIEFENKIKNDTIISNNRLQMIAKKIAKQSLLRKQGLSNCIAEKFPNAIRLSIHYQDSNSKKLGFKLIDKAINFGSPWFNIIYMCSNGDIILGKKNWFIENRKLIVSNEGCYYIIDNKTEEDFKNNNVNKIIKKEMKIGR